MRLPDLCTGLCSTMMPNRVLLWLLFSYVLLCFEWLLYPRHRQSGIRSRLLVGTKRG